MATAAAEDGAVDADGVGPAKDASVVGWVVDNSGWLLQLSEKIKTHRMLPMLQIVRMDRWVKRNLRKFMR
jgi:hypothetical protein